MKQNAKNNIQKDNNMTYPITGSKPTEITRRMLSPEVRTLTTYEVHSLVYIINDIGIKGIKQSLLEPLSINLNKTYMKARSSEKAELAKKLYFILKKEIPKEASTQEKGKVLFTSSMRAMRAMRTEKIQESEV